MNKREIIHVLIDKILDIEETSLKGAHFTYSTSTGLDIRFCTRPGSFADRIGDTHYGFTVDENELSLASAYIEKIKNTSDVEPKVTLTLSAEKARELGLIA
jgi:hypothetical protein